MKRPLSYGALMAAAFVAGTYVPDPEPPAWNVAHVMSVHDGDTFQAAVDLGYATTIVETFRLLGVDTPELKGETKEAAERSRDWVASQISNRPIRVREHGQDKYGRYLVEVQVAGKDLSQEIIKRGLGKSYFGGTRE